MLFILLIVGTIASASAHPIALWFNPHPDTDAAGLLLGIVFGILCAMVLMAFIDPAFAILAHGFRAIGGGGRSGGRMFGQFGNTQPGRWLTGRLIGLAVLGLPVLLIVAVLIAVLVTVVPGIGYLPVIAVVAAGFVGEAILWRANRIKTGMARSTKGVSSMFRAMQYGFGGGARFEGLIDEWRHPWEPEQLRLGASLYDKNWLVGVRDDRHFLTIATSRSGKGTSAIIPNLLTWEGSVLCIDPKGENAAVTAQARRNMGQTVHIVDPFGVLASAGLHDPIATYNPLDELNPAGKNIYEDLDAVADSLVRPDPKGDPFWNDEARALLRGLVAHAVSWPRQENEPPRSLNAVQQWLFGGNGLPLGDMSRNTMSGIAQASAAAVASMDPKVKNNVITTARSHVGWLNSPAIRQSLLTSSFSMYDLKRRPTTIYVVLPPHLLETHSRWLRLFVNMALTAASNEVRKPPKDILFVMDEFFALGRMDRLTAAAATLGGYGVKLWPIVQNLSQLNTLYRENWETFIANAGMIQVFAMNDQETARYFSERLGHHVQWREFQGPYGVEWVPQSPTWLRTPVELAQESSRDSGRQLIFQEGGRCFFLSRRAYMQSWQAGAYRRNPFQDRHEWLGDEMHRTGSGA